MGAQLSGAINEGLNSSSSRDMIRELLQLPDAALGLVLQQLDQRSLACAAVTCSTLSHLVPANTSKVMVRSSSTDAETTVSFTRGLERGCTSLLSLVQCSVVSDRLWTPHLGHLSGPKLQHLHLGGWQVRLRLPGDYPAVLDVCTGLTSLDLQFCKVKDVPAAAAAIAALPELRSLALNSVADDQGRSVFEELQLPLQLTHLRMNFGDVKLEEIPILSQLSNLVDLGHLKLVGLPSKGVSGGLPSQLVKLTCLAVGFDKHCDFTDQFQHLSKFTALQRLSIAKASPLGARGLLGIQHLTQLTSLQIQCYEKLSSHFITHYARSLALMSALQRLDLQDCTVDPVALTGLTQLQSLSLKRVFLIHDRLIQELFAAVSELSLLTELLLTLQVLVKGEADFTALTGNTNMCSLKLGLVAFGHVRGHWLLLQPGTCTVYPHLREIDLQCEQTAPERGVRTLPLSEQQIQQLCSCCPAVESLRLTMCASVSSTALVPLLQLSALTHLSMWKVGGTEAALLGTAGQLTRLKQLEVSALPSISSQLADPSLLQLTAVTALEKLTLHWQDESSQSWSLRNKARWNHPPDVWQQLQKSLEVHQPRILGPPRRLVDGIPGWVWYGAILVVIATLVRIAQALCSAG